MYLPLTAIYSSPLERALETAGPLAHDHGLRVQTRPALNDMDFGDWTGRTLDELADDPAWKSFNGDRGRACPPGGEALQQVQRRVVDELLALSRLHAGEVVAIVTHAEPIRCALAAFSGSSLDDVKAVEIAPGYVSAIGIQPNVRRVLAINMDAGQAAV
jgi:probable phosphoglycerate mutase